MSVPSAAASPGIARVVRDSIVALKSFADPERARGAKKYFKEQVEFLGVTSPRMRGIEADIWKRIYGTWTLEDAVAYAEAMLKRTPHEIRGLGLMVLLRFREEFPPSFPVKVRGWLSAGRLDNWALVDVFCPDALGPLLDKDAGFVKEIKTWTADPNRWVKRASAVSFIKLARRGRRLDAVYEIAGRLFAVDDDLIHKATGWLLREAGKTDAARLRAFLLKHGPQIPRTTLRYAIERFPEKERLDLMDRTRKR